MGILLALEGYVLAEYTLPLLGSKNYQMAANSVLVCWFVAAVVMLFGWHTRRMLSRSYARFLETIAVVAMIRHRLKLADQNIYPERWAKSWSVLLANEDGWRKFIEENMRRKDTAYAQMLFITKLLDRATFSIALALTIFLVYNIYISN